jgi:hypothetical protein
LHTTKIVTGHALDEAKAVRSPLFVVTGRKLSFTATPTEFLNDLKCDYVLTVQGNARAVFILECGQNRHKSPGSWKTDGKNEDSLRPVFQSSGLRMCF